MSEPFYAANRRPTAEPPRKPNEPLFEFLRGHDRFLCELRDHGAYGVEAQFYMSDEFLYGRRFGPEMDPTRPPRDVAIAWATEWRQVIEKEGSCLE